MRKTDAIFLFCVLSCAGLFAARSVMQSVPLLSGETAADSAAFGVAGQSRNVDMAKLKRLLNQRALSDHEAEFYEPLDTSLPGDHENQTSESPVELGRDPLRVGEGP
jgi:hypothetical protein